MMMLGTSLFRVIIRSCLFTVLIVATLPVWDISSSQASQLAAISDTHNQIEPTTDRVSATSVNLALGADPTESSPGWGGGAYPWDMVDGNTYYTDSWMHGLAFTGGAAGTIEPCGWRQATLNFGTQQTFNHVFVWHHGSDHIPTTFNLEYWDGAIWQPISATSSIRSDLQTPPSGVAGWGAIPTEHLFAGVSGSKIRFNLYNCDITHGWIYEFDVFYDAPPLSWAELEPAGPSSVERYLSAAAYDNAGDRLMLFGGYHGGNLNDTWVLADSLSGTPSWTQLSPVSTPSARSEHSAVYDATTNRLIVHGGCTGNCSPTTNSTWVLSNANGLGGAPVWTQLTATGSPIARAGHVAAYDESSNRMIVFGGHTGFVNTNRNDVWVLTNANGNGSSAWIPLAATGTPPAARGESAFGAYDSATNRLIIFGGLANGSNTLYNDTWILTNANGLGGTPAWTQLSPAGTPPSPRNGFVINYDPAANRLIVFGGTDGTGNLNDSWVLTHANGLGGTPEWIQLAPNGTLPPVRTYAVGGYSPTSKQLIVTTGWSDPASSYYSDAWVLSNADGVVPLVVSKLDDTNDGLCDSDCSLREAITAANSQAGGDVIEFAVNGTIVLTSALPAITTEMTINGDGATIDGAGAYQHFHVLQNASLTLNDLTLQHGSSMNGGSIYVQPTGTLVLNRCTLSDNTASQYGGAIASDGTLIITQSTISGNTAGQYSGGVQSYGALTLTNSTVSGNSVSQYSGGGLTLMGTATMTNSTIVGNSASSGGGISNYAALTLANTIVANNTNGDCLLSGGSITLEGINLLKDGACEARSGIDLTDDPGLGPLVDNAGPTLTHMPLPGSPVIDAGDDGICAVPPVNNKDQRNLDRPQDGDGNTVAACDIGSVEVEPSPAFCDAVTEIPTGECEALVALYNSTDGGNWTDNTNWLVTTTPSDWHGVVVNSGHVERIILDYHQLSGSIPDLSALAQLQYLWLGGNQLSGNIPDLSALTQLQGLRLDNNQLSGSIPDLSALTQLRELILGGNQLTGSIPDLSALTQLEFLTLGYNQLSGSIPDLSANTQLGALYLNRNQLSGSIPDLSGLAQLTVLYLSDNQLTGSIPDLSGLTSIVTLYLFNNQLSGSIPDLAALTQLQEIRLDNNQLSGSIPDLSDLTQLKYLRLDGNQLSGHIPALSALTQLETLVLNDNQISGSIPDLSALTQLVYLALNNNQLSGSIPDLSAVTNLHSLYLSNNMLAGEIPASIMNLATLTYTDIGYNMLWTSEPAVETFLNGKDPDWASTQTVPPSNLAIGVVGPTSIEVTWDAIPYTADGGYYQVGYAATMGGPYTSGCMSADKTATSCTVGGLTEGTTYHFVAKTFTPQHGDQQNDLWSAWSDEEVSAAAGDHCAGVTEIPRAECEALVALYDSTDGDNWTDNTNWLVTTTPSVWSGITVEGGHVIRIRLYTNELTGSLPDLSALTQLLEIDMSFNQLSGEIPDLSALTQLQHIYLDHNQLSGDIPDLSALTQLWTLVLHANQLTGNIPPYLGTLTQLHGLTLGNNQLTGTIPDLSALTQLQYLALGSNQLTGSVPAYLATFSQLEDLWLGDLQLTGSIPDLSPLTQLKHLDLAGNQLTGNIPAYLSTFTQLEGLWLGNNRLTGSIPDLSALTQLQTLWLENSALEGEIPAGITNLTALTFTGIGYNMLWTDDPDVMAFLDIKDPDWASTQTVPPSNLAIGVVGTDSIEVTWNAIPYTADGGYYEVGFAETAGGPYASGCTTADKAATSCTVGGLTEGTTYHFVVKTFTPQHGDQQNDLWSAWSDEVSATTLLLPLSAPSDLSATTVSQTQIDLSWTDNSADETAFRIERSPDGSTGWTEIGTVAANVTSFQNTDLTCGTEYFYRVRAYRAGDSAHSGYSNVASATTGACCYQLSLGHTGQGTDPTATPANSGGCPLAHYLPGETVALSAQPALYWHITGWSGTANDASTSTTNSLVMPASAHTVTVHYDRACLGIGTFEETAPEITYEGGWATWTGTGPSGGRMKYTSSSSARASFCVDGGAFVLFETKHPSFGTMEVCVDGACQSVSNYGPTLQWQVPVSFTDLGTGIHDVTVSNGPSGLLAVDAIAVGLPPNAPSGLHVTSSGIYQVTLGWTDNATTETQFRLYRDGAQVGKVAANVTTITDNLPDCGIDHTYEVRAYNLFGESSGLNAIQAQAACPAALPTGYYEQTNPNIILTGPWAPYTSSAASGGSMVYSFSPTVRAAFRIEGSGLVVYRILHPSGGLMHVCIDGSCQDVSNFSATVQWRVPVSFTGLGAGAHNVTITNPAGALLSFDAIAVGVPPTPPSGLQVSGTDIYEVALSWTDNATTETAFHVYRDGTQVSSVAANVTTFTDSVPDCGVDHTYEVRAANQFGESVGSDTVQAQATCPGILTPGYYEQTDPNIVLSGPWTTYTTGAASGGSMVYSTSPVASVVFRVEGTVLTLYRALHPSGGLMHVCIDGDCQDVNNYSASILLKQPVTFLNLGEGVHDVQITNPAGRLISLDAVEVKQPAPLGVGRHEQTHSSIFFTGNWATYSGSGPSGGSEKYTGDTAASIWFQIEGTQLVLYRIKHPSFGTMHVCIDGDCQDVNSYSPSILWQQPVVFPSLTAGAHNVVITDGGAGLISLDAVQVDDESTDALPAGIPISGCYEEAHPAWDIAGAWKPLFPAGASMDAVLSYSSEWVSGASLTFAFASDGFGLVYHKGPYGGIADIYLDGELVTRLDTYAPADAWLDDAVFEIQGLDPLRVHELRIVPTGERHPASQGYMIDIDRLDLPGYSGVYNDACRYPPEG